MWKIGESFQWSHLGEPLDLGKMIVLLLNILLFVVGVLTKTHTRTSYTSNNKNLTTSVGVANRKDTVHEDDDDDDDNNDIEYVSTHIAGERTPCASIWTKAAKKKTSEAEWVLNMRSIQ